MRVFSKSYELKKGIYEIRTQLLNCLKYEILDLFRNIYSLLFGVMQLANRFILSENIVDLVLRDAFKSLGSYIQVKHKVLAFKVGEILTGLNLVYYEAFLHFPKLFTNF